MEQLNLSGIKSRVIVVTQSGKHIFFGVDNKFISHALITVMSIVEHADGDAYHFHIISSDLREDDTEKYAKILIHQLPRISCDRRLVLTSFLANIQ